MDYQKIKSDGESIARLRANGAITSDSVNTKAKRIDTWFNEIKVDIAAEFIEDSLITELLTYAIESQKNYSEKVQEYNAEKKKNPFDMLSFVGMSDEKMGILDSFLSDRISAIIQRVYSIIKNSKPKQRVTTAVCSEEDLEKRLHDAIRKVSHKKYIDGHFADAVESACKEINDRLKKQYKKFKHSEKDGKDLFAFTFNDDETKTLLKVDDLTTQSGKDEQEGYRFLLMGMWSALRNPKAHANLNLTQDEAYDRLIFCSMLMKRIDKAFAYTFTE